MGILAKPTGVELGEHNRNLQAQAKRLLDERPFVADKYRELTGKNLAELLRESIRYHDWGKGLPDWQNPCCKDYEAFQAAMRLRWDGITDFAAFLRQNAHACKGIHLRDSGFRHEIGSLYLLDKHGTPLAEEARVAIAAHHGKFGQRYLHRWHGDLNGLSKGKGAELLNQLCRLTPLRPELDDMFLFRYRFDAARGALQFCDHHASAGEVGNHVPKLEPFSYTFQYTKRGPQLQIEKLQEEWFAILRAPTGSGKTDAALLWAQAQIEILKRADRVIFAMPTRFTSNALALREPARMSEMGLYHSTAWLQNRERDPAGTDAVIKAESMAARYLETPVTVTTIDHLCLTLTGTREDHHRAYANLANACLVIDEADFYDSFTQASLLVLLRACRVLRVPVLMMSATVPDSVVAYYARAGFDHIRVFEDTEGHDKPRWKLHRAGEWADPVDIADLLRDTLEHGEGIIYCNTVERAKNVYKWLSEVLREEPRYQDIALLLYHSQFTEPDKARKEQELLALLGKDAWIDKDGSPKSAKPRAIAILTQIGELSVNISTQRMLTDLCPLDRLAQRVGRAGRFTPHVLSNVHVLNPVQTRNGTRRPYPAPYGTYDKTKREWEAIEAFTRSNEMLTARAYTAGDWVRLVNALYDKSNVESPSTQSNREMLEKLLKFNCLCLPKQKVEQDAEETVEYSPRNIPEQSAIFVAPHPTTTFRTWQEYAEYELSHSVNVYADKRERLERSGQVQKIEVWVGDEKETIWVAVRNVYSSETGL